MFKNILVPTDGSALSRNAAKHAIALAKASGGKLIGFHVAPAYTFHVYEDYVSPDFVLPAAYTARAKKVAQRHLDVIKKLADAAGVGFTGQYAMSDFTADAIVKAAGKYRCDTIVMASHGRRGIGKLLLGSETQKVLVSTKVPVLVTH